MRSFSGGILLFILVTIGLYLTKVQQPSKMPSSLSNPSNTVMAHPISHNPTNVTNQLTSVTDQAETNYQLATTIRNCRNIPSSKDALALWLERSQQNNEPQTYIEDVLARFEQCSNLHLSGTNYIHLLIMAAEQYSDIAVSELWSISDREYFKVMKLTKSPRPKKISARQGFLQKKYDLAQALALTGAELSLQRLIQGYQNYDPETGHPNVIKALAYANFALYITDNNELYRKVDWIKHKLEDNLSFEAKEQAAQLTEQIILASRKSE